MPSCQNQGTSPAAERSDKKRYRAAAVLQGTRDITLGGPWLTRRLQHPDKLEDIRYDTQRRESFMALFTSLPDDSHIHRCLERRFLKRKTWVLSSVSAAYGSPRAMRSHCRAP